MPLLALCLPSSVYGGASCLQIQLQHHQTNDLAHSLPFASHSIQALKISSMSIKRIQAPIDSERGLSSRVLRVETKDGKTLALNLLNTKLSEVQNMILFQQHLAERGASPKIHGILDAKEVRGLLHTHPELKETWLPLMDEEMSFGILMDEVKGGWNINKANHRERKSGRIEWDRIPSQIHQWNKEDILNQISTLETTVNQAGIELLDDQLLISEAGEVKIIDFGTAIYWDPSGVVWDARSAHSRPPATLQKPKLNDFGRLREAFLDAWKHGPTH